MSVSESKKLDHALPAGFDAAMHLIELCSNPAKYEELLKPLAASVKEARSEWERVGIAGDIHDLRAKAEAELAEAEKHNQEAEREKNAKLAALDKEYTTKMAALHESREKQKAEFEKKNSDLKSQKEYLDRLSGELKAREQRAAAEESRLEKLQTQLNEDRKAVDSRYAALKEAFTDG